MNKTGLIKAGGKSRVPTLTLNLSISVPVEWPASLDWRSLWSWSVKAYMPAVRRKMKDIFLFSSTCPQAFWNVFIFKLKHHKQIHFCVLFTTNTVCSATKKTRVRVVRIGHQLPFTSWSLPSAGDVGAGATANWSIFTQFFPKQNNKNKHSVHLTECRFTASSPISYCITEVGVLAQSCSYLDIGRGVPVWVLYLCNAPSAAHSWSRSSVRLSRTQVCPASVSRSPHSECPCHRLTTAMRIKGVDLKL